jgi:ankyrin repeat protein
MAVPELETLSLLLGRGADVNARSRTGLTPMMMAANGPANTPGAIALLLAAGADVNAADDDGFTALIFAAVSSGPEMVSALLSAGADARARERLHGKSPADYAAENPALRDSDAYRRLLERARPAAGPALPMPAPPPVPPMMGMQPMAPGR